MESFIKIEKIKLYQCYIINYTIKMSSCGHMMFITDGKNKVHRNERCANACKRWDNRVLGRKIKNQESNIELGYNKQYISIINNQIDKLLYENKNLLILSTK